MKISGEKAGPYALCFETLSNELRLKILGILAEKPMSVQELAGRLKAERSRVSHSLEMLRDCRYVDFSKSGKERIYSLAGSMKGGIKTKGAKSMHIFDFLDAHMEEHCSECKKIGAKAKG